MIKINIAQQLQYPVWKGLNWGVVHGFLGGLVIVGIGVWCWWWAESMQRQVDRLYDEKSVKAKHLETLRGQLDDLAIYEKKTKTLQASLEHVKRLKGAMKDKLGPITVLSMMSISLNKKSMWFDQVHIQDHIVEIQGKSLTVEDVSKFMDTLEEYHVVKNLAVVEINDPKGPKSGTYSFLIRFTYADQVLT